MKAIAILMIYALIVLTVMAVNKYLDDNFKRSRK